MITETTIDLRDASEFAAHEPGLYAGVPAEEYHAYEACSASGLALLSMSSAAHLRTALDCPTPGTPSQAFGEAVHLAVLQPDVFEKRIIKCPEINRRTNDGKAQWEALVTQYGEKNILSPDDYDRCLRIRDSVYRHGTAGTLLTMPGFAETTVLFGYDDGATDESGGRLPLVPCKSRLDWWAYEDGVYVDLKTTSNASKDEFSRSIYNYKYFMQLAFYERALSWHGHSLNTLLIVAVEKAPPYAVAVYSPDRITLQAGHRLIDDLIDRYARCYRSGYWPAYPDEVQEITLPAWAWKTP